MAVNMIVDLSLDNNTHFDNITHNDNNPNLVENHNTNHNANHNDNHINNSINLDDDINSMLSNITNDKKKKKREARINTDKILKGNTYKEDFNQQTDIMLDINCNACNSKNIANSRKMEC